MQKLWQIMVVAMVMGGFHGTLAAQEEATEARTEFCLRLQAIPGVVEVTPTRSRGNQFKESYTVMFTQPMDHTQPEGPTFQQRLFVSHVDYNKPVLLGTEGYAARGNSNSELHRMLGGNQITVEHRYFGQSMPEPCDWKYLTIKQSADDLHDVVTAMKTLYSGKWISSGASKGGQTALFYKCHYPKDINVVVAYVAPINLAQEDPRMLRLLEVSGDAVTRQKIKAFQIALLKRQDEILPLLNKALESRDWTFAMGLNAAYEYGVLEYPYAFWQGGSIDPNQIPAAGAPAQDLLSHYEQSRVLWYYSDQGKKVFEPFLYQAFTEMGYYNYDITDFKTYLKTLKHPSNRVICPDGAEIVFNPATMYFVNHCLQYEADQVIYIYGEKDAWSATQIQLIGHTDAFKYIVAGAHHGASVRSFSSEQKASFYATLERWLGFELNKEDP